MSSSSSGWVRDESTDVPNDDIDDISTDPLSSMLESSSLLEPFRMQLAAEDIRVTHFLGHGDVVEAILTAAKEVDAGMIVMGTHGRKGLERIMLGSVAEQVIRRASRPVMVVRSQDLSVHPGPSETVKRVQDEADG